MGRKPINGVPMTSLERQRRYRANRKQERNANAHRLRSYQMEMRLRRALRDLRFLQRAGVEGSLFPMWQGKLRLSVRERSEIVRMTAALSSAVATLEALVETLDRWMPQPADETPRAPRLPGPKP